MKKITVFIILVIFISGCQTLRDLSGAISEPSLSVTDVRVTDFTFSEIELTYDVQIENPNPVTVQMLSYDYDFNINNNDFIEGNQQKLLRIEPSGQSTFQIPMRVNFQELYNLFSGLKGQDEAAYTLAANLDFDLPVLGQTTLPLKRDGNLPMLKLPSINVASLNVQDVNFSEANLVLNLQVDNPNGFGLLLNALSYNLDVNGRNWIDGSDQPKMSIGGNNSNEISIPISLNISEIGASVIQLLNNQNELNFNLNGDLDLGADHPLFNGMSTSFSFDKAGDLPIIRQ